MARIFIDPGHGGLDNGAVHGYHEEDDYNLAVAFLLEYELRLRGMAVELSRREDMTVPLGDRVAMAQSFKADAFVSIHCDAWHSETAKGYSTHVAPKGDHALGGHIHYRLQEALNGHKDRGLRESDFYVLRNTAALRMPSALVECEFISNPETAAFLKEPANQRKIALAIAAGIMNYLAY
jgi:N-acetylmuramoyl-L-alanine amidase